MLKTGKRPTSSKFSAFSGSNGPDMLPLSNIWSESVFFFFFLFPFVCDDSDYFKNKSEMSAAEITRRRAFVLYLKLIQLSALQFSETAPPYVIERPGGYHEALEPLPAIY